jgi:glycosyltransferase involved in cell wall biosynthesis
MFRKDKRIEIGVPVGATVIGIIGRLRKEKGYFELFNAMKAVMAKNSQVWFVIVGPEEPEKSDRLAGDTYKLYGIEKRTIWLGRRDDIPELLSCLDIYTLPSWREGFPRSAIEAAAMGLPIVATNIRGCRQVIENNVNGFLVPLWDVKALADALSTLVQNSQLREKMGNASHQKAIKEFDEWKVCKIVVDTYNELLYDWNKRHS